VCSYKPGPPDHRNTTKNRKSNPHMSHLRPFTRVRRRSPRVRCRSTSRMAHVDGMVAQHAWPVQQGCVWDKDRDQKMTKRQGFKIDQHRMSHMLCINRPSLEGSHQSIGGPWDLGGRLRHCRPACIVADMSSQVSLSMVPGAASHAATSLAACTAQGSSHCKCATYPARLPGSGVLHRPTLSITRNKSLIDLSPLPLKRRTISGSRSVWDNIMERRKPC